MRIAAMCKEFSCLPYAGGLMEQPGYAMLHLEKVFMAQRVYEDHEQKKTEGRSKWRSEGTS